MLIISWLRYLESYFEYLRNSAQSHVGSARYVQTRMAAIPASYDPTLSHLCMQEEKWDVTCHRAYAA